MPSEPQLDVKVRPAIFPADTESVTKLFLAYAHFLPIKLDFQNFELELANLPGKYAVGNRGAVYLAYITPSPQTNDASDVYDSTTSSPIEPREEAVGIVALRAFAVPGSTTPTCELKRLYLAPAARGLGVSKFLMDAVLAKARELGYKEMLLDTLSSMTTARKLYERYGFQEIGKYYESVVGAVFYKLIL